MDLYLDELVIEVIVEGNQKVRHRGEALKCNNQPVGLLNKQESVLNMASSWPSHHSSPNIVDEKKLNHHCKGETSGDKLVNKVSSESKLDHLENGEKLSSCENLIKILKSKKGDGKCDLPSIHKNSLFTMNENKSLKIDAELKTNEKCSDIVETYSSNLLNNQSNTTQLLSDNSKNYICKSLEGKINEVSVRGTEFVDMKQSFDGEVNEIDSGADQGNTTLNRENCLFERKLYRSHNDFEKVSETLAIDFVRNNDSNKSEIGHQCSALSEDSGNIPIHESLMRSEDSSFLSPLSALIFPNPPSFEAVRSWLGEKDDVAIQEETKTVEEKFVKDTDKVKSIPELSSAMYYQSLVKDMDFDENFFHNHIEEHTGITFIEHLKSSVLFGETADDSSSNFVDLSNELKNNLPHDSDIFQSESSSMPSSSNSSSELSVGSFSTEISSPEVLDTGSDSGNEIYGTEAHGIEEEQESACRNFVPEDLLMNDISVKNDIFIDNTFTNWDEIKDLKGTFMLECGSKRKADHQGYAFKKQKIQKSNNNLQVVTRCDSYMCGILDNSVPHDENCYSSLHKDFLDFPEKERCKENKALTMLTYTRKNVNYSKESIDSDFGANKNVKVCVKEPTDINYSKFPHSKDVTGTTTLDSLVHKYDYNFGCMKAETWNLTVETDVNEVGFFHLNSLHSGFLSSLSSPTESNAATNKDNNNVSDDSNIQQKVSLINCQTPASASKSTVFQLLTQSYKNNNVSDDSNIQKKVLLMLQTPASANKPTVSQHLTPSYKDNNVSDDSNIQNKVLVINCQTPASASKPIVFQHSTPSYDISKLLSLCTNSSITVSGNVNEREKKSMLETKLALSSHENSSVADSNSLLSLSHIKGSETKMETDSGKSKKVSNMLKKVKLSPKVFYVRPSSVLKDAISDLRKKAPDYKEEEEDGSDSEFLMLPDGTPIPHPVFIPPRNIEVLNVKPPKLKRKRRMRTKDLIKEKVTQSIESSNKNEIPQSVVIYARGRLHICQVNVGESR